MHPTTPTLNTSPAAAASARFWNRFARRYAAAKMADPAGYDATIRRVESLLSPGQDVLEVGCGTGTTALRLAGRTRHLRAVDVSDAMIGIAREKLALQPMPQLQFEVAAVEHAAAPGERYDRILAFNVLHLLPDLDAAIAALMPSLVPGGLFISKTPCLRDLNPLITHVAVPIMRAVGLAPPLLHLDAGALSAAFERQGLVVEVVERHATRGRDFRPFIVARKPG